MQDYTVAPSVSFYGKERGKCICIVKDMLPKAQDISYVVHCDQVLIPVAMFLPLSWFRFVHAHHTWIIIFHVNLAAYIRRLQANRSNRLFYQEMEAYFTSISVSYFSFIFVFWWFIWLYIRYFKFIVEHALSFLYLEFGLRLSQTVSANFNDEIKKIDAITESEFALWISCNMVQYRLTLIFFFIKDLDQTTDIVTGFVVETQRPARLKHSLVFCYWYSFDAKQQIVVYNYWSLLIQLIDVGKSVWLSLTYF